jgi:hypothetical protein
MRLMSGQIRVCEWGMLLRAHPGSYGVAPLWAAPIGGLLGWDCEFVYRKSRILPESAGRPAKSMWLSTALYGYWQDPGAGRSKQAGRANRVF